MKRGYEVSKVEISHAAIDTIQYNQLLDEWAIQVYSYFCQLPQNQSKAPVTFNQKAGA